VRYGAVLLLALVLAGCGSGGRGHGTATLWVTRDRGTHVVYAGSVPAGLNGIQTVERKLKVTTRYGGRFVQSIAGVSGSLGAQRDWFFYVNGIEGGRSAAEVRVHPGDVLWWDYRHWTGSTMEIPVVAGAYPEPFLHAGPTSVVGDPSLARPIAKQVHGTVNARRTLRSFVVVGGRLAPGTVHIARFRHGYVLELGADVARRLAGDPTALRYRF
jgi:uncharacterized protein DUF4430